MSDMLRDRARAVEEAEKSRRRRKRRETIAQYTLSGKAKRRKLPTSLKAAGIAVGILAVLAAAIYIPPLFYDVNQAISYTPIIPDASALKTYQTYLKNHPDDDFDEDGLANSLEDKQGTNIWKMDSDYDGVSDFAELYITETSPMEFSSVLMEQMRTQDVKNNKTLGTPYKIDDIIFWPDDYASKAYGGIVRTMMGYRFWNYTGWVRFPGKVYAYEYYDDIHHELLYRSAEEAYRITTSNEIRLYDHPLSFVYKLSLPFAGNLYLENNMAGEIIDKILPDKGGFITCHKLAEDDTQPDVSHNIEVKPAMPTVDKNDESRFGRNQNSLADLANVRALLEHGDCVAVSLYSSTTGEAIGIIYGYTKEGNLLVANDKLEPVGKIYIREAAMKMMNKDGEIGQRAWFEWNGLGFDSSRYGDRINFVATTMTNVGTEENSGVHTTPETTAKETMAEEETQTTEPLEQETMPAATQNTPKENEDNQTLPPFLMDGDSIERERTQQTDDKPEPETVVVFGF